MGLLSIQGSPPHTRGPPDRAASRSAIERITPAYAGTTLRRIHRSCSTGDHPRIRGDHRATWVIPFSFSGSPPHTRGPHPFRLEKVPLERITPAYAGTTKVTVFTISLSTDHPRIRGDHSIFQHSIAYYGGSPPHTRGPLRPISRNVWYPRITPAYAGTTTDDGKNGTVLWDHPRIRGDHPSPFERKEVLMGSPPHTRGPRNAEPAIAPPTGITPAYAGTTLNTIDKPDFRFIIFQHIKRPRIHSVSF